ncbi:MAG: hypothetical protein AABZ00_14975 [Chloroflexota bacterium]
MIRRILTLAICLLVAACNMPGTQQTIAKPRAWFDMPLPETVLIPPSPCQVVAHGASPGGIAFFELSINGAVAASLPNSDTQKTLATLNYNCSLQQPGKNILKLRVQDSAGVWSEYTETTIILAVDVALPTVTATIPPPSTGTVDPTLTAIPTLTATLIPTFTPTPLPIGSVTIEQVSTYLVYIGRPDCGPLEVTITARATAPNGIVAVVLFYRFEPGSPLGEFQSVSMISIGGNLYQSTLNPTSVFGGSVPFDQSILQYQIVIQDSDGNTSLRTPVLADISVQACGSVTAACSSFTDERSCIANACVWGTIPGTRTIACQNP